MIKKIVSDFAPLLAILIAVWIILLIPFQVIGHGFMPPDDAMRHSAKIVSGKDWNQILVVRDEIKVESYPGWDAILGFVNRVTGWDQHGLILFSVVSLFILLCLVPIVFLKYPESWLLTLFALSVASPSWFFRLLLGRPYIVTMASLMAILFMWPRLREKKLQYTNLLILTCIIAISVWAHASWYFFLFLIIPFMLARQWRASVMLAIASGLGILIAASFTGHPVIFLKQMITHFFLVFGSNDVERQLVGELRPMIGDYSIVLTVLMVLGWRSLRGLRLKKSVDNPVFIPVSYTHLTLPTKRIV